VANKLPSGYRLSVAKRPEKVVTNEKMSIAVSHLRLGSVLPKVERTISGNERESTRWVILNTGALMNIQEIVAQVDAEISKLQQVKALLAGTSTTENRKPGRPANTSLPGNAKTRRTLSAESRAKIAAAQRARWAKSKKTAKKATVSVAKASSAKKAATAGPRAKSTKKRTLSAEARAKIAAAQKARWAKARKAAKKAPPTKDAKKSETAKKSIAAA
jgi:hypothetical protein